MSSRWMRKMRWWFDNEASEQQEMQEGEDVAAER
jgi:hypothetical protein